MGHGGTADVGNLPKAKADASNICGAMVEQRQRDGCNENESVPQQFVHLVGCRDPSTRRAASVHPKPLPPKS